MEALTKTTQFFLYALTFGVIVFSPVVNSKETGGGFLRLLNTICGALLFVGLIVNGNYTLLGLLGLGSFLFASLKHQDKKSVWMWLNYAIQNIALIAMLYIFNGPGFFNQVFFFSSALILGIITFSMILGHWYLVTPKLSEKPLKICIYFLWSLLVFKIIFSIFAFLGNKESYQVSNSFMVILFSMRMIWGYLIIGLLSYFSFRLIKMRSIQSATGVLYVMTFFVLIGELISNYLYFKYGIYL